MGDVADVYFSSGPTRIDREDRQRQIVVYANTVGITPGDLIQKIQTEMIPDMNMQVGYRLLEMTIHFYEIVPILKVFGQAVTNQVKEIFSDP